MAYFAIISDKPANLKVVRCHINIWALNELAGMTFFVDVGLGLRATKNNEPITKFRSYRQLFWSFKSNEAGYLLLAK